MASAGALLPSSPLGSMLGFVPLPGPYWPAVLLIILGYCVLAHLVKTWFGAALGNVIDAVRHT